MPRPIPGIELYDLSPLHTPPTRRRFDWLRMADGRVWELSAPEDFESGAMRAVQILGYKWAERHGFILRSYKAAEDVLRVQFSPRVHANA